MTKVEGDEEGNSNILTKMGILLVIMIFLIVLLTVVVICVRTSKPGSKVNNVFLKVKNKLMWNSVIRSILQGYLKITLASVFAVSLARFESHEAEVNSAFATIFLITMVVIPFYFTYILYKNRDSLT